MYGFTYLRTGLRHPVHAYFAAEPIDAISWLLHRISRCESIELSTWSWISSMQIYLLSFSFDGFLYRNKKCNKFPITGPVHVFYGSRPMWPRCGRMWIVALITLVMSGLSQVSIARWPRMIRGFEFPPGLAAWWRNKILVFDDPSNVI